MTLMKTKLKNLKKTKKGLKFLVFYLKKSSNN